MLRNVLFAIIFILGISQATYAHEVIQYKIPDAKIVGQGVLSYAFWDIYKATLYAPRGQWNPTRIYALSIEYFREIKAKDIADRAVQEIRRQGLNDKVRLSAWSEQMKLIFPNVHDGTVLSAIYIPGNETIFYDGHKKIGTIKDEDFGKYFFAIWLDKTTSAPELRLLLLGQAE